MNAMPRSPNEPSPDDLSARIDDLGRRMDSGFNRIDAKLERQGEAIASHGQAIARLEAQAENTAAEFKRIDARYEQIDARLDEQAKEMGAEFIAVRREMSEGFQRMQRLMIEVGGGIVITLLVASRLFG